MAAARHRGKAETRAVSGYTGTRGTFTGPWSPLFAPSLVPAYNCPIQHPLYPVFLSVTCETIRGPDRQFCSLTSFLNCFAVSLSRPSSTIMKKNVERTWKSRELYFLCVCVCFVLSLNRVKLFNDFDLLRIGENDWNQRDGEIDRI